MTPRIVRLSLATFLSAAACSAFAQTPDAAPTEVSAAAAPGVITPTSVLVPKGEDPLVTIKLSDDTIDQVLELLGTYTGRSILRPGSGLPTAEYTVNLKDIPRSEAILAIETLLTLNGVGVAPQGDKFLKVIALAQAKLEAPEMITGTTLDLPPSGKIATKIFRLEFLRADQFFTQLNIYNQFVAGVVILPNANAAMITDTVSNLQRVETLIASLDRPVTANTKPKFYTLRNGAKASDLVSKLRTVIGTMEQQFGSSTTFNADDRTNQIILIANPREHPFFDGLIESLDVKSDPNSRNEVIYLKHAKASEVKDLLSSLVQGQNAAAQRSGAQSVRPGQIVAPLPPQNGSPATPNAPTTPAITGIEGASGSSEFSNILNVVNDNRSNSIIVSGTADDVRLIKSIVANLDIILAQVRIEIVIAEVTLSDNTSSGITQLGLKVNGDRLVGITGSAPGIAVAGNADATGFADISRKGGPHTFTSSLDLSGVIGLSSKNPKASANFLSVPTITTTHNKKAIIFVGETRPTINSVTSSIAGNTNPGASTSSITQQEVGLTITVTPLIGDGSVQLDLEQELSDTGDAVIINGNVQNVINKRRTQSFITARTGEVLVLGGLQKKTNKRSSSRFGPIPIIGDLFGARTRGELRTELIFFLRPVILTNTPADNASAMKQIEEFPNKDAVLLELDPSYVPPRKSALDKVRGK